ncbi:MAG TPA: Sec-dependent nitrous-oxide reductase [Gemmatimonadales bacterium]|nr:Sec-dependent nitrous-oxide reductase [Gemmatimonadales bacterium]
MPNLRYRPGAGLLIAAVAALTLSGCGKSTAPLGAATDAAARVYIAPGQYDELYAFMSGGFSGNVTVYGLPSGRLLQQIPVFSQYPEKGYGYSEETKALLNTSYGFVPWDDVHHPQLSMTDGMADGRWLFVNGNNTPRIARLDLTRFETEEIIEIPNAAGGHGSPYLTQNSEYAVSATRFAVPTPQADVPIKSGKFGGMLSFVKIDSVSGHMSLAFQILVPGYDYDLARAGKGPSHGWSFFSTYNTEEARTLLEMNASQKDKDYIAAVNWKQAEACVAGGKGKAWSTPFAHNWIGEGGVARSEMLRSQKVIEPADCPGIVYFLPTPKSPHGTDVDPTGEYIVGGGKLATVIPVHSFTKLQKAIADKAFDGEVGGISVIKYDAVNVCEVQNPGLGPLHTEFDDKGFAYTSVFISSEIVKWSLKECKVVDRVPTYYSIGHLMIPGGDTRKPYGKYMLALNKITKDRYLPTGPELTQAAQLYDISGDKMKLLLDFPMTGEPHYAQALPASVLKDKSQKAYVLGDNKDPYVTRSEKDVKAVRQGTKVHVHMTAIRSHFLPDNIEGIQVGDSVYFHVTNLEQDWDVPHGFAMMGAQNSELLIMPGQTRTLVWVPQRPGVYPFYCTDFCSALHQEMQGYMRVSAKGSSVPLAWNGGAGTLK